MKGEQMYYSIEDILRAEHDAIAEVVDFVESEMPEDYGLERIKGIQIMVNALIRKMTETAQEGE